MIAASSLELKIAFLFEEWSKPYIWYGAVNTAKEKAIFNQEFLLRSWLSQLTGKNGERLR